MCINKKGVKTTKKEIITLNIFDLKEKIKTENYRILLIIEEATKVKITKTATALAAGVVSSENSANTDNSRSRFSSCLGGKEIYFKF